jgi:hypothetical protein
VKIGGNMPKRKRFSSKENWEAVYLKYYTTKKAFKKFTQEEMNEILQKDYVKRITKYIAKQIYNKNRYLEKYGYGYEDLVSIAQVYAIDFHALKQKFNTEKDLQSVMISYIYQKFFVFLRLLHSKLSLPTNVTNEESFEVNIYDLNDDTKLQALEDMVSFNTLEYKESNPIEEEIDFLYTILFKKIEYLKKEHPEKEIGELTVSGCKVKPLKELLKKISMLNEKLYLQQKNRKIIFTQLRSLLLENIEVYADDLKFYAESKFVDDSIRRCSRALCHKFGIEYKK